MFERYRIKRQERKMQVLRNQRRIERLQVLSLLEEERMFQAELRLIELRKEIAGKEQEQ